MKTDGTGKPLLAALDGVRGGRAPFWLMRQAGRYLPEYRELRAQAGGFLDLVYNPSLAAEITMQPLRRFGMDAAILFSDILVIAQALGASLAFAEGEGPVLSPVRSAEDAARLRFDGRVLEPVYETVSTVRAKLRAEGFSETALIGFAGAPWTVAVYMVEGGGSREMIHVKSWACRDPDGFGTLIETIAAATVSYLSRQIEAGAEAIQLFDSWAGVLDEEQYKRWVIAPTARIARELRALHPAVKIIGFPRGSGALLPLYAAEAAVDTLGLDSGVPLSLARELQRDLPVQGNLDPVRLLAGGRALEDGAAAVLDALSQGPFIFNLGHGVIKETPPAHVARLAELIREHR